MTSAGMPFMGILAIQGAHFGWVAFGGMPFMDILAIQGTDRGWVASAGMRAYQRWIDIIRLVWSHALRS